MPGTTTTHPTEAGQAMAQIPFTKNGNKQTWHTIEFSNNHHHPAPHHNSMTPDSTTTHNQTTVADTPKTRRTTQH